MTCRTATPIGLATLAFFAACAAREVGPPSPPCALPVPALAMDRQPNAALESRVRGVSLELAYGGRIILKSSANSCDFAVQSAESSDPSSGALTQRLELGVKTPGAFVLEAELACDADAFACEVERPPDREASGRELIVRHSFGPTQNRLNRAVYDRDGDWVLSAGAKTEATIEPIARDASHSSFRWRLRGDPIELVFRPRFFQKHRGLRYFEPWKSPLWNRSVVGWCSWFAYGTEVDEKKVLAVADVLAKELAPFGLEYVQIDDGYQRTPTALPETWLVPNEKFPSGLKALADGIRARGLKPALWVAATVQDPKVAKEHRELFVRDARGEVANGKWIGNVADFSQAATLDTFEHPLFRGLRDMGWDYVKLDALRHLRYEGYNSFAKYFEERGLDRVAVYRNLVANVRADLGRDRFLLACWGARPELAGLVDGCRIATDGFRYGCLEQFNSFNNVVWRNDPDHIQLEPGVDYRSCLVTSLTGSLFMITDKAERYANADLEAVKRTIPVLDTRPAQLYDVDPSRSDRLGAVDEQKSGDGPTIFDGNEHAVTELFQLDLADPTSGENWTVLGSLGRRDTPIRFEALGLPSDERELVFDFWHGRLLGEFTGSFQPPPIDAKFDCNLLCIRKALERPQLLASNRHVSCGALEMRGLRWSGGELRATSDLVGGDDYVLWIRERDGFAFAEVRADGAEVVGNDVDSGVRRIVLRSARSKSVEWSVNYRVR